MNSAFSIGDPGFDYTTQNPGIIINGLMAYFSFENPNCWLGDGVVTVKSLVDSNPIGGKIFNTSIVGIGTPTASFSGSLTPAGYISCTPNTGLTDLSASSYCFWTDYYGGLSGTDMGMVCSNGNSNFICGIQNDVFGGGFHSLTFGNSYIGVSEPIWGTSSLEAGPVTGWHFWSIVYKNGITNGTATINWYKDGNLINTTTNLANNGASLGDVLLIGINDINTLPFPGYIHMVAIYNRALSATEIKYNYNATRWKFLSN